MPTASNLFKRRIAWWLNPWILAIAFFLILAAIPMIFWIASYDSSIAVMMFVITYASLLVFVLFMVKRSMLEPHLYFDEKLVEKQRKEIEVHRKETLQKFLQTEFAVLQRGEKTPVLDVWRLNPTLRKRHLYFQLSETVLIEPMSQELQIRIQIGEILPKKEKGEHFESLLFSRTASFLRILSQDEYLRELKPFFKTIVMEIYSVLEDDYRRDIPFPLLSFFLNETALNQFTYSSSWNAEQFSRRGELRYSGGSEIVPHRGIESLASREMN